MPQNLILDKYYDVWLSIGTKNSPLSGILLLLQAAELRRSKMKIFKQKKVKISNFELQKRYIPQKKAKNMYSGGRKYASPTKVMSDVLAILTTFRIAF